MRECKLATQEPCNGQSTVGQPRFEQHWAQTARLLCNEGRSGMDPETVTTWRCRQTTKDNPQHKTNLNYKQKPSSKRGEIRHGKGTNCTEYSMLTTTRDKGKGGQDTKRLDITGTAPNRARERHNAAIECQVVNRNSNENVKRNIRHRSLKRLGSA